MKRLSILLLLPLLWVCLLDFSTNTDKGSTTFSRGYNNNKIASSILFSKSRDIVIIVGDSHYDRVINKSLVRELSVNGFSTLSYDYKGQGRSFGAASNSEVVRISENAQDLYIIYKNLLESNEFAPSNIYFLANSDGAKVLLSLLEAYQIEAKNYLLFNYIPTATQLENLKTDPTRITTVKATNSLSKIPLLYPKNIKAILSALVSLKDSSLNYQPTFYPLLRIFSLFFTLIILIVLPLLCIIFHFVKKLKAKAYQFELSLKNLLQFIILDLYALIPMGLTVLIILAITKVKIIPTIGVPYYFLPAAFYYIIYGPLKYLLYKVLPKKLEFNQILEYEKSMRKMLPNQTTQQGALEAGLVFSFSFLIILVLSFRTTIAYIIPFNARQFWFLGLMLFSFYSFYLDAIENSYLKDKPLQTVLFTYARYCLLFFSLLIMGMLMPLYLFALVVIMGYLMQTKNVKPLHIAFFQSLILCVMGVPLGPLVCFG